MDELPTILKLTAPLPCFGAYIQEQMKFRDLVLKDGEEGKDVAYLDSKVDVLVYCILGVNRNVTLFKKRCF